MKISIQQNENDCGLYVIKALYEHYHEQRLDLNTIREELSISNKGISIYDLISVAKKQSIILTPFEAKVDDVLKNKNEYFVVTIKNYNFNHYVIIEIKNDYINVFDPDKGKYKLLYDEFINIYNGVILTIEPQKLIIKNVVNNNFKIINFVFSNGKIISMNIFLIFLSLILTLFSTFFMKIIFDKIIPNQALNLLFLIIIIFISLAIIRVFLSYIKSLFVKKISLDIEILLYQKYASKLAKAHYKEILKFDKSDLLRRMLLIENCSIFLSGSLFFLIEESIMLIISMSILIYINPHFFAIVFAASMLMILISIIFHFILTPLYKDIFKKSIKNFSYQNIRVNEIVNLKKNDYKIFSDYNFKSSFYNLKTQEYLLYKLISWKNIFDGLISGLIPIIITYIFVKQIFFLGMKPGNMLLFLTIINFFNNSVHSLTDYFLKLKQNLINLNYIKEIFNLKEEKTNPQGLKLNFIKNIFLENISFKYKKQILNISKLELSNSVRIIATNGMGKSTLLKLIAFCFLPQFSYKINNIDYSYYSLNSIRDNIFYLESNSYLSSNKILSFITLNDVNKITCFETNLKKYKLNNFLWKNKIRLENNFKEGAIDLSSGQKQIINLMRLFTHPYKLIVLDEAFENISSENFKFLQSAICDFQKNAIFIEVSHNNHFLANGKVILLEKINKVKI